MAQRPKIFHNVTNSEVYLLLKVTHNDVEEIKGALYGLRKIQYVTIAWLSVVTTGLVFIAAS